MSGDQKFDLQTLSMDQLAGELHARRTGKPLQWPTFTRADVVSQLVHVMDKKFGLHPKPIEMAEIYISKEGLVAADNRRDWWQLNSMQEKIAMASSVAIMDIDELEAKRTGRFRLTPPIFKNICAGERFADQLGVLSACSGVLVNGRFVVSAQHCFTEKLTAGVSLQETVRFVFGYWRSSERQSAWDFGERDIYRTTRFEKGNYFKNDEKRKFNDWIVFELDRVVTDYPSARLRPKGYPKVDDRLYSVGYQHGMSGKYCDEAKVHAMHLPSDEVSQPYFISDLDQFNQCSGAPVFSAENHWVEGITVIGSPEDYDPDGPDGCDIPKYVLSSLAEQKAVCVDVIRPVIENW